MARREYFSQPQCVEDGCTERALRVFSRVADKRDADRRTRESGGWRCTRHSSPETVLSPGQPEREHVYINKELTAKGSDRPLGLFWCAPDSEHGSGFAFGPGFRAFAKDFPEGTRLVVTSRIELPEQPTDV